jgi:hypothetical protein
MVYEIHPLEKLCPKCGLIKPLVAFTLDHYECLCCHASAYRHYYRTHLAKALRPDNAPEDHPFNNIRFGKGYDKRSAAIGREVRNK